MTPDLLKECGYTHLLDWPFDDQPIWMRTRSGPILSVPYPSEMNDFGTLLNRDHTGTQFADMIVNQFEEMLKQSEKAPLVCSISLHGFVVGQPFPCPAAPAGNRTYRQSQAQGPCLVHNGA